MHKRDVQDRVDRPDRINPSQFIAELCQVGQRGGSEQILARPIDDDEKIIRAVDFPAGPVIFQRFVVLQDNRLGGCIELEIRHVRREKRHREQHQSQRHDRPVDHDRFIQPEQERTHHASLYREEHRNSTVI